MGRNNRQRRAAKARARHRGATGHAGRSARQEFADEEARRRHEPTWIRSLLHTASRSGMVGRQDFADIATERLAAIDPDDVAPVAESLLVDLLGIVWDGGWQPAELHREARRSGGPVQARLVVYAIGADHRANAPSELHPRWDEQLDEVRVDRSIEPGWMRRWRVSEGVDVEGFVDALVGLLSILVRLPRIETLLPPRGAAGGFTAGPLVDPHDPILVRVRALLAQAESTTFEAEAEAFTAKAHALMARHAIDAARVAAASGAGGEHPVTVRLPVDEPYVEAKSLLLHVVAESGRCRAVYYPHLAVSSIVGFPSDVASVELLFTSLLVQAQSAMVGAAATAPPGAKTRSRRFRSSFLRAYAIRIGERLEEINATVLSEAEAEHGMALVPVLEERAHVVDEAFEEMFPDIKKRASGATFDPAGWASGEQAADLAKLNPAELSA